MRVLQVGSGLSGWAGIEQYVVRLSGGLAAKGHDVSVTVPPGSPLAGAISGGIEIRVRNKLDLAALSAYLRLFRGSRFDVVHTHFNPDFLVVAYAAKLRRVPRLVMTRHVALPWARLKAKNFSRLYDRIVPVSEAARKRLLASGVPAEKMRVAKAGCPALEPSASGPVLEGRFKVGFFGRLAREKGIEVLLQAAREAEPKSGIGFHLFGDGPLRPEVEAAAQAIEGLSYHGFRTDVAECISAVDAVVIPSVWEEAFPYSALEAMSVGRAIVASDVGGLPELVQPKVNGLLFKPGDAGDLNRALGELSRDRALTHLLGERGREIQRSEYTVERMAERMLEVYEQIPAD